MRRLGKSWWMAAVAACGTALPAPLRVTPKGAALTVWQSQSRGALEQDTSHLAVRL